MGAWIETCYFSHDYSPLIMWHPKKEGQIVVPNHGASEVGAGLQNKILKDAGLR